MSAPHRLTAPLNHHDAARGARTTIGESLLLRFLVQRGIVHQSLLKLIEVERAGSCTSLSLVDWLVQRGHVSEAALTSVLAACLKLQPNDLAPFALAPSDPTGSGTNVDTPRPPRHLRLVSSKSRTSSDGTPSRATSSPARRRTPGQLPRLVRRSA
jgi:hypothetical protein